MRTLPARLGLGHRAGGDQVVERDDLGLDEAALEVGVDDAGGLRRGRALADRPRARLLRAGREVRLQARACRSRRGPAGRGPDSSCPIDCSSSSASSSGSSTSSDSILASRKIASAGATSARSSAFSGSLASSSVVDVEDVEERLGGEQVQLAQRLEVEAGGEERRPGVEQLAAPPRPRRAPAARSLLIRASFSSRGSAFSMVCRSARISSVLIVSMSSPGSTRPSTCTTSGSVKTRITWQIASDSRMLREELVAQALPLGGALDDAGDVDERDRRRAAILRRAEDLGEHVEPRVRDADDADVRLDRRERVVRREHVVLGQRVEQRGLADVGQADDADGEAHGGRV